jgi:hypothetical protein
VYGDAPKPRGRMPAMTSLNVGSTLVGGGSVAGGGSVGGGSVGGGGGGGALTVMADVPRLLFDLAVTIVLPGATAVTTPPLVTVATAVLADSHETPGIEAVSLTVWPTSSVAVLGVTVMFVGGAAADNAATATKNASNTESVRVHAGFRDTVGAASIEGGAGRTHRSAADHCVRWCPGWHIHGSPDRTRRSKRV